jgi:hypothetical protein
MHITFTNLFGQIEKGSGVNHNCSILLSGPSASDCIKLFVMAKSLEDVSWIAAKLLKKDTE